MSDQALQEFLVESREALERVETELLAMEAGAAASDRSAAIFRAVHTIKGTAGFFGFARLEALVHQGESLLSLVRDGRLDPSPEIAVALLAMVDLARRLLAQVEAGGAEGDVDPRRVIALLERLQATARAPERAEAPPRAPDAVASAEPETDGTIRVDVRLLDKLMDLTGELVLVRNQALRLANDTQESQFLAPVQRLNLVATELQESVMKTRMQPIGTVWSKLPRVVRDLAVALGKRVKVDMHGADTELDRTVLEAVRGPLTHLVRNAVDHGVEPPSARAAAGKPPEGRLTLRAFHEGGTVNLEISDDGAGVDWRRVAARGVELGLITPEQAARQDDKELSALLFRTGFTTASQVTTVSGRGVGLDVVKLSVERIGGTVDLVSRPGAGTTFRVKIPLTLAIIPALLVTCRGERYALPQVNVLEIVRVDDRAALGDVLGAPVFRLRGKLLTVIDLRRELAGDGDRPADDRDGAAHVVVLRAEERTFGLLVDDVLETEEIVVKPLPAQVKGVAALAGATIMGDGRVALILDAVGLAQRASLLGQAAAAATPSGRERRPQAAVEALLLVEICGGERAAIPLSVVSRIEELAPDRIERSGGAEVVQYRGEVMPLVRVSRVFGRERGQAPVGDALPVVVHGVGAEAAGLAVERIVDIVEEALPASKAAPRPGVLGAAVIQQRVTELLDVPALVEAGRRGLELRA